MAQQQERDKKFSLNKISYGIGSLVFGAIATDVIVRVFQGPYALTVIMLTVAIIIGGRILPGGPLRREAYGGILAVRLFVILLLIAYPFICWAIIQNLPPGFWASFLPTALFTLMITLLGWQSLRTVARIEDIGLGTTLLLLGGGITLLGVSVWQQGTNLSGIAGIVIGIGTILLGVSMWQQGTNLLGVAGIVIGIGLTLLGVSVWQQGTSLLGVAGIVIGIGAILLGVSMWQQRVNPAGIALITVGIGTILLGISMWQQGVSPTGIALITVGIGTILLGISMWQQGVNLASIALFTVGIGMILCQGTLVSAHRRPGKMPTGGQQNCPLTATTTAH